ncbi:zinc finger and SCAN domain-containing protein 12-like isoform X2 [Saccostrea cucullata]|uniref:zinc finger and SCAN domain-containing protein 12-like isoform X2 n=1 Tax=Saccostrea cuccullata TaxID=36930 RepID=UPI002ECFBC26
MESSNDPKRTIMLQGHSFEGSINCDNSTHNTDPSQPQMLENGETPSRSEPQVIVVSSSNQSTSFSIPFSQLRTIDGQSIDISQLSIINSQPLQLSSMVGGSCGTLGGISIMGTLMAPQTGEENQLNLVQSVALDSNVSAPGAEGCPMIDSDQNYSFTPIQNVFNVMGIPQGSEQIEIYPSSVNCVQSLSTDSNAGTETNQEVKGESDKKTTAVKESRNVIQNVQLSWPESVKSSNIQLVIPEDIATLNSESNKDTIEFPTSHQKLGLTEKQSNPKFVSLLPSNIKLAKENKTTKLDPQAENIDVNVSAADSISESEDWSLDKDKQRKQQMYSMFLEQLSRQHSALLEMMEVCQSAHSVGSGQEQFEKFAKIFTEKLEGLIDFFNVIKPLIDNYFGSLFMVDQSIQTETIPSETNNPQYSSVSGRRIRQTKRIQAYLEPDNDPVYDPSEEKSQNRKRRRKTSFQEENQPSPSSLLESSQSMSTPDTTRTESKSPLLNDTQGNVSNYGDDIQTLAASEEKGNNVYLVNCEHQSRLDPTSEWVKSSTGSAQIDQDPSRYTGGSQTKRVFKTKKQYEAEAQFKFFCQNCSFKSKRASHFRRHLKLHDKISDLFACKLCSFKTIRQSTLRKHEISHSIDLVKCKQCPYVTDSEALLSRHVNFKHSNKKRHYKKQKNTECMYTCADCGETISTLSKYSQHLKLHNPGASAEEFTFQCDQCDYKTKRKEHFNRHKMNHSSYRPHLCDTCGMAFKRSDTLSQHKQVHLEKVQRKLNFVCQICNKGFRSKCHLAEHMAMHSNSRQYLCDICGASFKTKSCQLKHVKNIHQNPRSYPCTLCEKRFNTNFALKRHERTHENDLKVIPASSNMLVTQNFLADVSAQSINQAELVQATDIIIAPSMEENYDQTNDMKLQQVLSDNASAIMFLSSSLPTSWN